MAEDVTSHIQDIYNRMQQGILQLADSTDFANAILPGLAEKEEIAGEMATNVSQVAAMHRANFSGEVEKVKVAVENANWTAMNVSETHDGFRDLSRHAEDLIGQFRDTADGAERLSSSVEEVNEMLEEVQSSLDNTAVLVSDLITDDVIINDVIEKSQNEIESSQQIITNVETRLADICSGVDTLKLWVGNPTLAVSGSGMESDRLLEPKPEEPVESESGIEPMEILTEQLAALHEGVESVQVMVEECGGEVERARQHASSLTQEAAELDR